MSPPGYATPWTVRAWLHTLRSCSPTASAPSACSHAALRTGTTNFVHQFPFVCTCIGFAVNKQVAGRGREGRVRGWRNGKGEIGVSVSVMCADAPFRPSQVVVGVVYAPILNELFVAVRGQGATLNGAPITVSAETDLAKALLATEVGVTRDAETVAAIFDRVQRCAASTRSVRATGSCAMNMCSVAMGRLDAFYEVGFGGPWDVAGASLIVEEAGGVLSNMQAEGAPFDITTRRVLCGAPALVPQIAAVVRESKISPHEP